MTRVTFPCQGTLRNWIVQCGSALTNRPSIRLRVPRLEARQDRRRIRWSGLAGAGGELGAPVVVQHELAEPHVLRGDLDALVLAAELQALLQREPARGDEL